MIKPYVQSDESKKVQVEKMFDQIAGRYDFFNHFFSLGIDRLWRKKAIRHFEKISGNILDIATGTADMAILACKKNNALNVTGIDISENMLRVGREKINKAGLQKRIGLKKADSENMPFQDDTFEGAMVAFGVRNFGNLEKGLSEVYRILKKDGIFIVLEFSKPDIFLIKQVYSFYFKKIIPWVAGIFSKDEKAYKYLPASVMAFPEKEEFIAIVKKTGFSGCSFQPLTFGIATLYTAQKK